MTTAATEAVTLPRATLTENLAAGLEAGESFPFFRMADAPAGYAGSLILPADSLAGWAITAAEHSGLRQFIGQRGWWIRPGSFTTNGEETLTLNSTVATGTVGTIDLSDVPEQYRAAVPDNARWCTTTRDFDGVLRDERYLAIPYDTPDAPILLAWPGHQRVGVFGDRPGVPEGWRGYWSHGYITWDPEPSETTVPEITVGMRVRVTDDGDEPHNNGREATVVAVAPDEANHAADRPAPYRVRYDNNEPGGEYGWWVCAVEALDQPATPITEYVAGQLVEVHGYGPNGVSAWNGHATFVRVDGDFGRVIPLEGVNRNREGGFTINHLRPVTRPFAVGDRVVLASPHVLTPRGITFTEAPNGVGSFGVLTASNADTDDPLVWGIEWEPTGRGSHIHECCLRLAAAPAPTPVPDVAAVGPIRVGDWFTWGMGGYWYRADRVVGDRIYTTHQMPTSTGQVTDTTEREFALATLDRLVVHGPESTTAPDFVRAQFGTAPTPEPTVAVGNWYTWRDANNWYEIDQITGDRMRHHRRISKAAPHRIHEHATTRGIEDMQRRTGWQVVDPTSADAPDFIRALMPAPVEPVPATAEDTVESLRQRLAEVQAAYDGDLRTIAEIMQQEARDRDWCGEYEQVARRINGRIAGTFNGERAITWEVQVSGTVTSSFTGRVQVNAPRSATSEDVQALVRDRLGEEGVQSFVTETTPHGWGAIGVEQVTISEDFRRITG